MLRPESRLRVRCPQCGRRFLLSRADAAEEFGDPVRSESPAERETGERDLPGPSASLGASEISGRATGRIPETADDPALQARRARRLARALVGEIARGREPERRKALEDGSIILAFGEAIRRAWREFQEQAPPDYPEAATFFREALNEFLAEGKRLF